MLLLIVYVDDIIITGGDALGIADMSCYLQKHFQIKDLGSLLYFLGIKVARCRKGITFFYRKYVYDIESMCLIYYMRQVCWDTLLMYP